MWLICLKQSEREVKGIQRTDTVDIPSLISSKYATYREKLKDSANGNKKI